MTDMYYETAPGAMPTDDPGSDELPAQDQMPADQDEPNIITRILDALDQLGATLRPLARGMNVNAQPSDRIAFDSFLVGVTDTTAINTDQRAGAGCAVTIYPTGGNVYLTNLTERAAGSSMLIAAGVPFTLCTRAPLYVWSTDPASRVQVAIETWNV